jgi:hypothetical protein
MSKYALNLLRVISLLNRDNSVGDIYEIPGQQLQGILRYYYESRAKFADREISDLAEARLCDATTLSSISADNEVQSLCPKLLVQNALIVGDPLMELATPTNEHTKAERESLGMDANEGIDLVRLSKRLNYFSALAPLIEAGFLHVLPLALLHEAPDRLPVNFPKNLYREQVPPGAVEFVSRSAIVNPLDRTPEGLIMLDQPNLLRKRHICITFAGDDAARGVSFFSYRDFEYLGQTEDGCLRIAYKPWSDDCLDQEQYDNWVELSINQVVGARLQAIAREMRLADIVGAPYMTESAFEGKLLALSGGRNGGNQIPAVEFLEANRELIRVSDPNLILRLRTRNEAAFQRFRISLAGVAEDLKGLSGDDFEQRARQLFEAEIRPQIAEVNSIVGGLAGAAAKGVLQTGSALYLALLTGGSLPVAAWLALGAAGVVGEALPLVGDYLRARNQPQFIWNKLAV